MRLFFLVLVPVLVSSAAAQAGRYQPKIKPASGDARRAMAAFELAPGLTVELVAAEPMLANPVCFDVDRDGVIYVAESFRLHAGVTDNRQHLDWIDDDLACRTVADRVAMYERYLAEEFESYTIEHERIRCLIDDDGDGAVDRAPVFADGFNEAAAGIGAGLLAEDGVVWYTCIPKLWRLTDTDRDGVADQRVALYDGFGVHTALLGHDMHGLCYGPDGRLYFSIGDRGFNVTTADGRQLVSPDTGAVLRCNRDGSDLEVFATGLRNPQELAFDDHGNLFTGDNNSDGGDRARWVYVVEAGDSGWRMSFQYLPTRGPWNEEKLWHPHFRGQAAWIVPPIANLADGPSGLVYDTGVGLPERYRGHFLLCDFRGGSGNSGIHALAVAPKGATFELSDHSRLIWRVLATDVDFGPDGSLYLSDWTEGWNQTGKGRMHRLSVPSWRGSGAARELAALMRSDFDGHASARLIELLGHADRRVRQRAQFELAGRGAAAVDLLAAVAAAPDHQQQRLHATWALWQLALAGNGAALPPVVALLSDGDGEIRSQAAKILGDVGHTGAAAALRALLRDDSSRVRYFAAQALGRLGDREAVAPLFEMLRHNAGEDPVLRHAGAVALARIGDVDMLLAATTDTSTAVRMAALLALRRLQHAGVARWLNDAEVPLVVEAARAIHDVPIAAALPALAAVLDRGSAAPRPLLRRAINAGFRLGGEVNARRLAAFAAAPEADDEMRVEALAALGDWIEPSGRDRVLGLWRPLVPRSAVPAVTALTPQLATIFAGAPARVQRAAVAATAGLEMREVVPTLTALADNPAAPAAVRVDALRVLETWQVVGMSAIAARAAATDSAPLRREGFRITAAIDPVRAIPILDAALAQGLDVAEQRFALSVLAGLEQPRADAILRSWLARLQRDEVPLELQLDVLEAAAQRPTLAEAVRAYQKSKPSDDPLAPFRESLAGGNAAAGRGVFRNHAAATCRRCHAVGGDSDLAGPNLAGVGSRRTRRELLMSLVAPNATVTAGFGTVVVTLDDGSQIAGVLKDENAGSLRIQTADGAIAEVAKARVRDRTPSVSAMPPMAAMLTPRQLRDVIEYLATLVAK